MIESASLYSESILVVDDEALNRMDLVDHLEDAGYRVFEAESADQAIAILERNVSIRVVITDIQMPGSMDGIRLAHYIRKRYPPTVLVISSGGLRPGDDELPENCFFVPKPFDPGRLIQRIEQSV